MEQLKKVEDSLLVILCYQLFPLATGKLMGDNKEFDDWAIFWGVWLIVEWESLRKLKIHHWSSLVTIVAPSNQ